MVSIPKRETSREFCAEDDRHLTNGKKREVAKLKKLFLFALLAVGCGGATSPPPPTLTNPNASITGQYNLVLTSTNGHGTTNIYTNFTQTGAAITGAASTLVCPSNNLSQCEGNDAPAIAIIPSGKVRGASVSIVISFPSNAGADTVTMTGTAAGTTLGGTYSDSLGDSGTWTASTAIHPFAPPPGVYDYSGTFNSTLNPLLIAPTIFIELGQDANSHLTGSATITNSPCINSLALSGQAIGDALSLTDASSQVSIIALPTMPTMPAGNSFTFSYKFEPTAANCGGDVGSGVVTINASPFDY
jgi:hypothetical protein